MYSFYYFHLLFRLSSFVLLPFHLKSFSENKTITFELSKFKYKMVRFRLFSQKKVSVKPTTFALLILFVYFCGFENSLPKLFPFVFIASVTSDITPDSHTKPIRIQKNTATRYILNRTSISGGHSVLSSYRFSIDSTLTKTDSKWTKVWMKLGYDFEVKWAKVGDIQCFEIFRTTDPCNVQGLCVWNHVSKVFHSSEWRN